MAILEKRADREDWVRWAIAFMVRGLWLDPEITVHGPHERGERMWGDAWATVDATAANVECRFFAKARRNEHDPFRIHITACEDGEAFPLVKTSALTLKARRYLRALKRTKKAAPGTASSHAHVVVAYRCGSRRSNISLRPTACEYGFLAFNQVNG